MDCTLKIIAGPEAGQEFVCSGPETYLGRSQRCAVRLGSPSVSFEHALITRMGDNFFVENLSANGTILNNERLLSKTRLRAKDQIRMGGDTVARVESLPAAAAAGSGRSVLLASIVAILAVVLLLVIRYSYSSDDFKDTQGDYRVMQQYAQEQAAMNGLPQDVPALLYEAWRLESVGDRDAAGKAWMKLHVKLDAWDQALPPDDKRNEFKQFVIKMEQRK